MGVVYVVDYKEQEYHARKDGWVRDVTRKVQDFPFLFFFSFSSIAKRYHVDVHINRSLFLRDTQASGISWADRMEKKEEG